MKVILFSIVFVLLLFIPPEVFSQSIKIPYKQLSWSDFQGTPGVFPEKYTGEKSDFVAFTWTKLAGNWKFIKTDSSGCQYEITQINGVASFYITDSWAKESAKTSQYILNHEQRHFDITKIQAGGFERELRDKTFSCPGGVYDVKEIHKMTKQVFQKSLDGMSDLNTLYDLETDHGANKQKQADWNLKLDCMLENIGSSDYCLNLADEAYAQLESSQTPESTPSPGSGGCLIATAIFGSELASQVQQLRELRDTTLLQTSSGSAFMTGFNQFYYLFSPTIADWERQNPAFQETVKIAITPLLTSLSILNYVDIDSEADMLGYGIVVVLLNIGMYFVTPAIVIIKIRSKFN